MSDKDEQSARASFESKNLDVSYWPVFRAGWEAKVTRLKCQATNDWCDAW